MAVVCVDGVLMGSFGVLAVIFYGAGVGFLIFSLEGLGGEHFDWPVEGCFGSGWV
jgi:hypothetical protein